MIMFRRLLSFAMGAAFTVTAASSAWADDIEIYESRAEDIGAKPNVLFIIDTSSSMDSAVAGTDPLYDPLKDYSGRGGCPDDRVYFSVDNAGPPSSCSSADYFSASKNRCDASKLALNKTGVWPGVSAAAPALQYRSSGWKDLTTSDAGNVECRADEGVHGSSANDGKPWLDGRTTAPSAAWSATNQNRWGAVTSKTYRFYSSNYMNYLHGPKAPTDLTRMQIVRNVAMSLANSLTGVNLGLMRYTGLSVAQGGYIVEPIADIGVNRNTIVDKISTLPPDGYTPLSETLYEAARYFQGLSPKYGVRTDASGNTEVLSDLRSMAVGASGKPGNYISPIKFSCQKNFIVYLTDGAPTKDEDANEGIKEMIGNKECKYTDTARPFEDTGFTDGSGMCMDELSGWLAGKDDVPPTEGEVATGTDLAPLIDGKQTLQTYMIGFGNTVGTSKPYLDEVAAAGGTVASYTATDVSTLTTALQKIFTNIQQNSGTFVTPSIAVNAFNRAQTDEDLYFSLFKVGQTKHWNGNLKKYKLIGSKITAQGGVDAVNANGFFKDGTSSFWSTEPDGGNVEKGGTISLFKAPASRPLYTSLAGQTGKFLLDGNLLNDTNMNDQLMGIASADPTKCGPACTASIAWARGSKLDLNDYNTVLPTSSKFMGDPLHGRPAVITYGKTSDGQNDTVIFVPTNDGFLHAISGQTGEELWGYIPPEMRSRLQDLRIGTAARHTYGLDGDVRVLRMDVNQDGTIQDGDRVWIFFGMRAGGNRYYGLDVTTPGEPKLMWNIGPEKLPNVGETWSPPVVARVRVGANGNVDPEKFVLIFGGGYDTNQESQSYSTDTVGNRIYMVDAKSGELLWSAGGAGGSGPSLPLAAMNNSIPGRVTVIDTNGDGLADRMYAGDMGGRIWRFDITNGNDAGTLVAGGVFATLGVGGRTNEDGVGQAVDNRRFYNAPDVSLVQIRGTAPFYNIAIGSGYRGHPLDKTTVERFYSLRDMNPYTSLPQTTYDAMTPIKDSDEALIDITDDPAGTEVTSAASGWKFTMTERNTGEKVLSESTTVNNVVLFTSFQPTVYQGDAADEESCFPTALNRAYALTAFGGKPAINFNDTATSPDLDNSDISTLLNQKNSIVGDITVAVLRDGTESGVAPPTICLAGIEVLKKCVDVGGTVRTFWNRRDAK